MKESMDNKERTDDSVETSQELMRSSMHWEEFFGSSLDLAPALLSIYDTIAAKTNNDVKGERNQGQRSKVIEKDEDSDENADSLCKMASTSSLEQDRKKRPLSISSMSSTSTSSLPRYSNKRQNLAEQRSSSECDEKSDVINNNKFTDKLDHLLYIDDDATSGNTDEEMSVDTDSGSKSSSDNNKGEIITPSHSEISLSTPSRSVQSLVPGTPSGMTPACSTPSVCSETLDHSSVREESPRPQIYMSYTHRVVTEIVETERIYINNLKEILEGYLGFIQHSDLKISSEDVKSLFGNIEEIYEFGKKFLLELEACGHDPIKVAECFVRNNDGFRIYAEYCTNYPSAVEVLTMIMKDPELCEVFRHQQSCLNHNLPLGAYLLKPVQRVLKYHLLLQNILKNYGKTEPGREILTKALDHMTSMAHHINEMKRKHEHAVRVQEIQSQLEDYEGEDLTRMGELVLEGSFRIYGAKTSRQVFLFEKGVLIGKRKEDGMLSCRVMIQCSNLMLVESVPKEPLSFQVIPFDNPRGQHTLQARNLEQKRRWCQEIKRLIIESFKGKIPEKVKGLVMQLGKSKEEESVKYATVDSRKISHHNAPEYLERRHRLRRKSGTMLTDLLKPQRMKRGQRRAESVSPRSSPPSERKFLTESPSTPNTPDLSSDTSLEVTPRSAGPVPTKIAGRSISFRQAINRQPLRSVDLGMTENKENNKETPTSSRRNKSFKQATKLNTLLSMSSEELNARKPLNHKDNIPLSPRLNPKCSTSNTWSQSNSRTENPPTRNSGLLNSNKFCSMPVLNVLEPSSPLVSKNRKWSEDFTSQDNVSSAKKKIFDTKLYFQRNKNEDLKRGNNSVSAFHDSFHKKSTENLSNKVGPIKLTKPHQFIPSYTVRKQSLQNLDPWERKTDTSDFPRSSSRMEMDQDIDTLDWIVYANRNSLPVDGFNLGPKLSKHCSLPQSVADTAHAQIKPTKGDNKKQKYDLSRSENCLDNHHFKAGSYDSHNFGALPVVKVNKPQVRLNRSISNPMSQIHRPMPRHHSVGVLDTHVIKDHEQIIAEMEDYMKRSESTSTVSSVKFPSEVIHPPPEPHSDKRDSCLSTFSNSSYESTDTTPSSPNGEHFMGSLMHKIQDFKQKLSHRRSGSYDNRDSSDNELDNDRSKPKETRTSRLSLFSKKDNHTDLQTVLHAGDLGSPFIGQRMAEQEPDYININLSLPRAKHDSIRTGVNEQSKSEGSQNLQLQNCDSQNLKLQNWDSHNLKLQNCDSNNIKLQNYDSQNLRLQNCDSAFSIQGDIAYGCCIEDSPHSQEEEEAPIPRPSSSERIYERQLSVAFNEGEVFRDSAVYCEMDPERHDVKCRAPIKSVVQKLEEKSKYVPPPVTKVKQREPGAIIKQRLESLQIQRPVSRPSSVERELRFYSRPASIERELRLSSRSSSEDRPMRSSSVDKDMVSQTAESSKIQFRPERSIRHSSVSRYSDEMSSKLSNNRLDQLTTDLNNLIVMRGWVKLLIDKFQTK